MRKEKLLIYCLYCFLGVVILSMALCACHTEEDVVPSLSINPSDFTFLPTKGDSKSMTIETDANAEWIIYLETSKIALSSKTGRGPATVTLTTTEDNETRWKGQMQIVAKNNAGETTKNATVTHLGSNADNCYADIAKIGESNDYNMQVFSYGMACVMEYGSNTKYFLYKFYTFEDYQKIAGNNELIVQDSKQAESGWKRIDIPSTGGIEIVNDDCIPGTTYELVTVAYAPDGSRGNVSASSFAAKAEISEPLAVINIEPTVKEGQGEDAQAQYRWRVEKKGTCASYYTYVCASTNLVETMKNRVGSYGEYNARNGVNVAWLISLVLRGGWHESNNINLNRENNYNRDCLFVRYENDETFSFTADPTDRYLQIVTWGLNRNGEFSGLVSDVVFQIENGDVKLPPSTSAMPATLGFEADASDSPKTISLTSNEEWTAKSSDTSWCVVSPASGCNDGNVTVMVTANTATSQRTATVTIKGSASGDETKVTVTQNAFIPELSVMPRSLEFNHDSDGSQTVQVTCNEGWKAESNASWCKVENKTATSFTVTAEQNQTFSTRSAIITVTSDSGKTAKVEVTQLANDIEREDYGDDEKKI